jgi:hypothetical protein
MPKIAPQDRAAGGQFELLLRIQQPRNGHPSDAAAGLRSKALIEDVLNSKLGVQAEAGSENYVRAQGFSDPGNALAASRALQLAFEGFRSAIPAERATISVVLDSVVPDEFQTLHSSPSVEQKELLNLAKPSQVLITQALYHKIAQSQPLGLRSFPARAGVYEFVWTSLERLEELRAEAEVVPTLVIVPDAASLAEKTLISRPVTRAPEPPQKDPVRPPAPQAEPVVGNRIFPDWIFTRRAVAIGSAFAILIAICSFIIWNPFRGHLSPQRSRVQLSPELPASPPDAYIQTVPLIRFVVVLPRLNRESQNQSCAIPGEIPAYLQLAEGSRNSGRYDNAERQYRAVLACDPNNRQALQGLQHTREAEAEAR